MTASEKTLVYRAAQFAERLIEEICLDEDLKKMLLERIRRIALLLHGSELEASVGILYQMVECGYATPVKIGELFGADVRRLIEESLDPPEIARLPLQERRVKQAGRLKSASPTATRLKLAEEAVLLEELLERPETRWTRDEYKDYIVGTLRFAGVYRSVAHATSDPGMANLENEFMKAYQEAYQKYCSPPRT